MEGIYRNYKILVAEETAINMEGNIIALILFLNVGNIFNPPLTYLHRRKV
jgi:hypothetical protein